SSGGRSRPRSRRSNVRATCFPGIRCKLAARTRPTRPFAKSRADVRRWQVRFENRWPKQMAQAELSPANEDLAQIRESVRALCAKFPGEYWRALDRERAYPTEFVAALTQAGFLAALIPEDYGGSGLSMTAAAAIMEEIQASGCNGAACHAQ